MPANKLRSVYDCTPLSSGCGTDDGKAKYVGDMRSIAMARAEGSYNFLASKAFGDDEAFISDMMIDSSHLAPGACDDEEAFISEMMSDSSKASSKALGYVSDMSTTPPESLHDAKPTEMNNLLVKRKHQSVFELNRPDVARSCASLPVLSSQAKQKPSKQYTVFEMKRQSESVPVLSSQTKQGELSLSTKCNSAWQKISTETSPRPSASVHFLSSDTKQEPSSPPKRTRTWQEISSEINRFAQESMKNAGWEDLWTSKKKAQPQQETVDEATLYYFSMESSEAIHKREAIFQDSLESQQKLQAWDKMMGLKRSHSRTMTKSAVTRKKMLHAMRELKLRRDRYGRRGSV